MEKKDLIGADHTKQYLLIGGCKITATFSEEYDPELYRRVRDILMACSLQRDSHTMDNSRKE